MLEYGARNLTMQIHQQSVLFKDLSLKFKPQTLTLITGENGCGKSTLLKILSGQTLSTSGKVLLNNQPIHTIVPSARAKYVAYLPQNVRHYFTFNTGIEQFRFALANLQLSAAEIEDRIRQVVVAFNLNKIINQPVLSLSGGELQRLAFGLVVSLGAEYLLLDEPFANLDQENRQQLLKILSHLKRHATIITTDHNLTGYAALADQWLQFDHHQLIAQDIHKLPTKSNVSRVTHTVTVEKDDTGLTFSQLNLAVGGKKLLNQATLSLPCGKIGLLCGKNGSGKSTLFAAATKQTKFTGEIIHNELSLAQTKAQKWLRQVTLGFQNSENQFIKTTVNEELMSALHITCHPEYWTKQQLQFWINQLHIENLLDESPYFISGGQQKKVQLLILAIIASPVILLDEIFAGLDNQTTQTVFQLLKKLCQLDCAILVVDHQLNQLPQYDYVVELSQQQLHLLPKGAFVNA